MPSITKNGKEHFVVINQTSVEEQQALLDLYEKLDKAERQSKEGGTRPFRKAISDIKGRIHATGKISD